MLMSSELCFMKARKSCSVSRVTNTTLAVLRRLAFSIPRRRLTTRPQDILVEQELPTLGSTGGADLSAACELRQR